MKPKLVGLLAIVALSATFGFGGSSSDEFKLLSSSATSWEIEYTPSVRSLTTVIIDGKTYYRFLDPTFATADAAVIPPLPTDAISLGIPFGATLSAELLNVEYEIIEHKALAPSPSYQITDDSDAIEVFDKPLTASPINQFVPSSQIEIQQPFALRQQSISTIRLFPYQYNSSSQSLRRISKATLRVKLHQNSRAAFHSDRVSSDPHFEETYKSLLWNYEQAQQWRTPIGRGVQSPLSDPTHDWFETGKNYYRALIANDGWYKITRAEIQAARGNLSGVNLATLKMFAQGSPVPIIVRPDTSIEFFALRNYGDSTYKDFFTDTSAYWLTWGGSSGLQFTSSTVVGSPSSTVVSAAHTAHFEQDVSYFSSSNTQEAIDINTVSGEDWVWRFISANGQYDFPFTLDSIDVSTATATVRARLCGIGYIAPPGTPTAHKARFWINDSLVGDLDFPQRKDTMLNATFPTSWLKAGSNTLRVRAMDTGLPSNVFHVDWFEIGYQRRLRASNNQLKFVSPNSSGGIAQFLVNGFTSSQIEVFDLTTQRQILGGVVSGDVVNGYAIAFLDTCSSQRTYVAFGAGSQRTVPPLKQKMFSDIRVNPAGADYIIITHKNFLAQSNQLATHRQNVNGVRAKVIDVEDIYDEFNYGVISTSSIREFLRHAYLNWAAPAPSYVLFMGDASWDVRRNFSNTIKTNYVPSYGFPTSDNWFSCFDTAVTFIPSLLSGRIPAEDATQAQIAVNKIIGYDNYPLSLWNKNFLFVTGGNNLSEQAGFNYLSEVAIDSYVKPAPLGATPIRVYKSSPGIVDGDYRTVLKNCFRDGIGFMNFTGHSGGRIWSVDMGPPSELENTNGKLPFIASVSCNVGGFSASANSVISEQFLFADNRGAIAMWASSSLGYATYGAALTNYWLHNAAFDSVREFGKLTTNARYRLWFETGSGYITVAMVNLNPLIGDPLSKFAVPRKPELAIASSDIIVNKIDPTPNDTSITIRLNINNYGLVATDSVGVTLQDVYNGQTTVLLNNRKLVKTFHRDSLTVTSKATTNVGLHTFTAQLDPLNTISEVSELNNIASVDQVIYTNNVFVVKPLNGVVVSPGVQRLVVTSPIGYDSTGFQYYFELDTVDTFNSPALLTSGAVAPQNVSGEWFTPAVANNTIYFWRVRTMHGSLAGNWLVSSFSTSSDLPATANALAPRVRWRQNASKQFLRNVRTRTTATDSGVTITPSAPISLYCRSVGNYYDQFRDYYSTIIANGVAGTGYWEQVGRSFVAARVNEFTGAMDYRYFPLTTGVAFADSMAKFINTTTPGTYIAVAVIFNGQTNVNEALRMAMDTLGATQFRSIVNGQTYAFIGRKGNGAPGMTPLELLRTNDSAVVSLTIPAYYGLASGSMTAAPMPIAQSWDSLHWRREGNFTKVDARVAMLGIRAVGGLDTLRVFSKDSVDVNLASLNAQTNGPRYSSLQLTSLLSTSDATITPTFKDWWMEFSPPPDLAVSARTVGVNNNDAPNAFNLPVTVYNIGYAKSDSVLVTVSALDKYNRLRQLATATLDSIDIDGSRSRTISFATNGLATRTRLQVTVRSLKKGRDLVPENNTAYYMLYINNAIANNEMRIFANGVELMDGDYVSPTPTILVRPKDNGREHAVERLAMLVDNKVVDAKTSLAKAGTSQTVSEQTFTPTLANGRHELKFHLTQVNALGELDSIEQTLTVNVSNETRLMNVTNFPNPFRSDTYFTFVLTGAILPEELTIRVFTVSGRNIRDISVGGNSLQYGFNKIYWDGRDTDGDELANGYYFYQVQLKGEATTESAIQKLAKIK